ncbi:class I SAM-dependent methyltransferase [Nitriliruptor alkaliphilus]|uniref:class I SAM-dependent methyltransferase n=1 Tax=Nitriliruptor alkaliphilus TaxID=427918 RepID=UPI000696AE27|nr:class I SAM-dependent methyltransferase [Nitriliruptor alkaliphilus]
MPDGPQAPGSASLANPRYWWYQARSDLMHAVFARYLHPGHHLLDVGSADGPSVGWLVAGIRRTAVDLDPGGLEEGDICASVTALPFRDAAFDVVSAFDVVEHIPSEAAVISELRRVARPGGVLLVSVPAYQWAWTSFDVAAGHHRRYTRRRLVAAVEAAGLRVERATYAFASTMPLFIADRVGSRLGLRRPEDPAATRLPAWLDRWLIKVSRVDRWLLRRTDLPFGSSIFLAARVPGEPAHPPGDAS